MRRDSSRACPRREFFRRSGAGAAAAALAAACGSGIGEKNSPGRHFRLGMASYTFREFSLEVALANTRRLGLSRIALKSFHLPLNTPVEDIRDAAARIRGEGFDLYGGGVIYMKNRDEVERAFAYAEAAGMSVIIGVPDESLLPLVEEKVTATGIRLAIHNHGPTDEAYPSPESALRKIRGRDPGIGICLDAGHTMRCGIDPSDSARACGGRLLDVHIKDVTSPDESGTTVEIGRGVIDVPRFLRTLMEIGYRHTVSLEFEKDGSDPLPGAAESMGYVRGALGGLRALR